MTGTGSLLLLAVLAAGGLVPRQGEEAGGRPAWQALWDAGARRDAVAALERAAADEPSLRPRLATWQLSLHRYEAALVTASDLGPAGRAVRARSLYLLGRHEQALAELDAADPLEALMRVDCLEILGRDEELRGALEAARAARGPDDASVLAARGRLHLRAGRAAEAVAAFESALAADPLHPGARFGLGRALLALGRRDEALEHLAQHRRILPLLDARDHARRALDLAPRHPANHAQLGDTERALGRLDAAEAAYRTAASLAGPGDLVPVVLRHARLLAEDRGQPLEAVALLDGAAEVASDPRLAVRAADLLVELGRRDEAVARYQAVLAERPGDPALLERLAAARAGTDTERPATGDEP